MLRAFGAIESEIRRIHLLSGAVMAVLSFVLTLGMGYAANYLLYVFCNTALPSMGLGSGIRYDYYISVGALLFSALIAIVCGLLSSVLPYYIERMRAQKLLSRETVGKNKNSEEDR